MTLIPTREFNKTVSKLTDKIAKRRLEELTAKLESAKSLKEIPHVLPIENASDLFRITTGDFRLLVKQLKNGEIIILLIDYRRRNEKTYKGLN
jgi:mRNA-degrading endonuclease RelE of RelBE toxin-antitoxin system